MSDAAKAMQTRLETAFRRAGGLNRLSLTTEGKLAIVKMATGEALYTRDRIAVRASEIATDVIDGLFEDVDPLTHEAISLAVFDAVVAAFAEGD